MIDNDDGDQFTEALANTCRTAALPWDLSVLIASLRSVQLIYSLNEGRI
jgi:hypothetical protein